MPEMPRMPEMPKATRMPEIPRMPEMSEMPKMPEATKITEASDRSVLLAPARMMVDCCDDDVEKAQRNLDAKVTAAKAARAKLEELEQKFPKQESPKQESLRIIEKRIRDSFELDMRSGFRMLTDNQILSVDPNAVGVEVVITIG